MVEIALRALAVFAAFAVLDFCWAAYTQAVADRRPLRAALWAGVLPLLGLVGTVHVVEQSPWYALPMAAGAIVGTYVAVWRTRLDP